MKIAYRLKWEKERTIAKKFSLNFYEKISKKKELFNIISNSISQEDTLIHHNAKKRTIDIDDSTYSYNNAYVLSDEVEREISTCVLLSGITKNSDKYTVLGKYEKIEL